MQKDVSELIFRFGGAAHHHAEEHIADMCRDLFGVVLSRQPYCLTLVNVLWSKGFALPSLLKLLASVSSSTVHCMCTFSVG